MKTLYVSDLDGTLLSNKESISPYSVKVINELVEKGLLFTYATARSLNSASKVAKGLNVKMPVIVHNGAFIMQPQDEVILRANLFEEEEKKELQSIFTMHGLNPFIYALQQGKQRMSWLSTQENAGMKRYLDKRIGDSRLSPVQDAIKHYEGDVYYFTCIGEKEELEPVYELLKGDERFHCMLEIEMYCKDYWLEIMPKKTTKANATLQLKKMLGCDRIVVFGDGTNDIPMFEVADECYAVENAVMDIKERASAVIGSNEEDGVAKWLLENGKINA